MGTRSEEEHAILRTVVGAGLVESIRRHIVPIGGIELALAPREGIRRPPKF